MIRRHSLADISSLSTDPYPFDSLDYPHNTYHDPNNEFTIYTLRRASSPVMLPTARSTAPAAEVNGQPDQSKSAKKKNKNKKKKKANSRNSNKGEGSGVAQESVESVEGNFNNNNDNNNASMPLIVNGTSLKHRTEVSGVTTEVCPWILTIYVMAFQ